MISGAKLSVKAQPTGDAHDIVGNILVFQIGRVTSKRLGECGLARRFLFRLRQAMRPDRRIPTGITEPKP